MLRRSFTPFSTMTAQQIYPVRTRIGIMSTASKRTMRDGVNLSRLAHRLVRLQATLGVDEVRREDGVDERRLAQPRLS